MISIFYSTGFSSILTSIYVYVLIHNIIRYELIRKES